MTATASGGWKLKPLAAVAGRRAARADPLLQKLAQTGRIEIAQQWLAELPQRRGVEDQPLVIDVHPGDAGLYAAVCRHASGAVTLHAPEHLSRRAGGVAASTALRFRITTHSRPQPTGRRGLAGKIIKFVLVKIVGKLADHALERLTASWEQRSWKARGLQRGLLQVQGDAQGGLRLGPLTNRDKLAKGRALLFIHGTFSHFSGCFGDLGTVRDPNGSTLFESVRDLYGDRIVALNHFTLSETPLQNARQFLDALPNVQCTFDVVTHSRGGLVLRALDELRLELGSAGDRFRLRNAVLVACPNRGTPLASPDRWETLTSWIVNLVDLFPENPFTFGVEFVAEALGWLAKKAGGVIPGLAAMNPHGQFIGELQGGAKTSGTVSALVANYEPDGSLLARTADLGIDAFFATANDLVVPTEGGWQIGDGASAIPGTRIGCFGPAGNLAASRDVHHCNFFKQSGAVEFLSRALRGEVSTISALDTSISFSAVRSQRRIAVSEAPPGATANRPAAIAGNGERRMAGAQAASAAPTAYPLDTQAASAAQLAYPLDEILNLYILVPEVATSEQAEPEAVSPDDFARTVASSTRSLTALMIASFRNARVSVPFRTSSGSAGSRWLKLIDMHRRIKGYVDGSADHTQLPTDAELRDFGALLFNTLFPGQVRRLYDAARAELRDRRLDVCLTSTIGWVADMPWEFAFDPSRQMFLCMEEVNFLRNISTAVPADSIRSRDPPLRILVIAAQPIGAGALSITEEQDVIRRSFQPMIGHGMAHVDVVAGVTPQKLHEVLSLADVEGIAYDVLHFIGHGEFDSDSGFGYLLFEDAEGRSNRLRADHFRQIVARRGIRLVFLNACETGTGIGNRPRLDFAQGAAPMLVAGGLPAVVANQFKVLDPSAAAFAQHFYWALASGRTIGDAAREARVAVNYSIAGEAIDWAVPVLFARNPGDRLITPSRGLRVALTAMTQQATASRRRSSLSTRRRIAILDVNYVIPTLPRIIERLNAAQSYFEFEAADIPTPLGTWRRPVTNEGLPCLYAQDVEAKLTEALRRLGASQLCCVTNLPLADPKQEQLNLSSHVDAELNISMVSTARYLDRLEPPELSIEKLLTNFLAFVLSRVFAHKYGPKNCPSYWNEEHDIRIAAGAMNLCKGCQKKLKGDPARRDAIQALTAAWD